MFPPQGSSWAEPYIKKISKTGQHDSRLVKLSCKARKTYLGEDVLNSAHGNRNFNGSPQNIAQNGKCYIIKMVRSATQSVTKTKGQTLYYDFTTAMISCFFRNCTWRKPLLLKSNNKGGKNGQYCIENVKNCIASSAKKN